MKEGEGDGIFKLGKDRHEAAAAKATESAADAPKSGADILHHKKFEDIAEAIAVAREIKEKLAHDQTAEKWSGLHGSTIAEMKTEDLIQTIYSYQENLTPFLPSMILAISEELLKRFPEQSQ